MKPKKTEYLLKSYFYFNKQERKGINALIILLILMLIFPHVWRLLVPSPPLDIRIIRLTSEPISPKGINVLNDFHGKKPFPQNQPPISIKDTTGKRKLIYPIELNATDSETLVALYRIGPGLAHRILEYRNQLGGFVSLDQLTEIWGFDEDILFDLKGKIKVNVKKAKRFQVNAVTYEQLSAHPYFKYKLSKAIVNYRLQHGVFTSLEELKKVVIVNDSVYSRITKYLYF